MGPFTRNEIEKLERIQRQGARFILNDYKNREPGCVTQMLQDLDLPSLESRRQQQRLKLLYKIQDNQLPSMPPEQFLNPANKDRRRIRLKTHQDCEDINILQRLHFNNSKPFQIPVCKDKKYRNSFFIRTLYEWNALTDTEIETGLASAAPTALRDASPVSGNM